LALVCYFSLKRWSPAFGFFGSIKESNSLKHSFLSKKTEPKTMYSSRFLKAFERIIYHEGGYANNASDLGGETKYGISKRSYPHLDIKNLTLDQARQIYYFDFWIKGKYITRCIK
jgi:hypothetical protein